MSSPLQKKRNHEGAGTYFAPASVVPFNVKLLKQRGTIRIIHPDFQGNQY